MLLAFGDPITTFFVRLRSLLLADPRCLCSSSRASFDFAPPRSTAYSFPSINHTQCISAEIRRCYFVSGGRDPAGKTTAAYGSWRPNCRLDDRIDG